MTEVTAEAVRSYGCSYGCGNAYDFILVNVADGSTEFLCLPDFIRLASDLVEAVVSPDSSNVAAAMAAMSADMLEVTPGPAGKRRGKNAPVTVDDPDLLTTFDSLVTEDELPPEFR